MIFPERNITISSIKFRDNNKVFITDPVSINKLFTRVTTLSKFKKYTPVIHNSDPWVVTFDTFLTDEEADMVIQMSQGRFRIYTHQTTEAAVYNKHADNQNWLKRMSTFYDDNIRQRFL